MQKTKCRKPVIEEEAPKQRFLDSPFLLLVFTLLATGLIALFSSSYAKAYYDPKISTPLYFVIKQCGFMILGIIVMYMASYFDYHRYIYIAIPIFLVALILLILVPFFGQEVNDAKRWLFGFQPSEVMKTAVIIFFSAMATVYQDRIKEFWKGLVPYLCMIAVIAGLLYLQPHLSATIIIAGTGMVILFVAGIKVWYFFPLGGLAASAFLFYIQANEYAMTRIRVWIDPFIDPQNKGWQGCQSFIAIGSGGFWGLGLGQSRQKHLYLPEPMNDFIFSVICEELGFIGATLVTTIFAALIVRGFYIAIRASDRFGCLLATGVVAKIAIQTLVNMCVVSGLMPITGASLPFFSYGGTALVIQLFEVGMVLNISRQIKAKRVG